MNKVKPMTKPRKILRTVAEVITAYGGTGKMASEWDVSPGAVSQWRIDGIPPGYHYRMVEALERRGFNVDGKALGWR